MHEKEKILQALKGGGYRITKARSAIIDVLLHAKQPLSSPGICTTLNGRGLACNRATVYRELIFLASRNVVRRVLFAGKAAHYEINSGHHHHLVCIKCNSVKDVLLGKHLEYHERRIYERERFKVFSHSLEFYGVCNACSGKQEM